LTGTWAYKVQQQNDALEPKTESKTGTDSEHENQNIIVVNKTIDSVQPRITLPLKHMQKNIDRPKDQLTPTRLNRTLKPL